MFQLHVSIYVSIINIGTNGIILFHNCKSVARAARTDVGPHVDAVPNWNAVPHSDVAPHDDAER